MTRGGSDSVNDFSLPPGDVPLGIQRPLGLAAGGGQGWLQPKFMTPLGTRSLTVLNPAIFLSAQEPTSDWRSPFEDSPFFDTPDAPPAGTPQTSPTPSLPSTSTIQAEPALSAATDLAIARFSEDTPPTPISPDGLAVSPAPTQTPEIQTAVTPEVSPSIARSLTESPNRAAESFAAESAYAESAYIEAPAMAAPADAREQPIAQSPQTTIAPSNIDASPQLELAEPVAQLSTSTPEASAESLEPAIAPAVRSEAVSSDTENIAVSEEVSPTFEREQPPQVLGDIANQSAEPFSLAQRAELVPEPPEPSTPELPVSIAPSSEQPLDSTQLNQPDYPAPETLSEPLLRQAAVEPEPSATSLSEAPTRQTPALSDSPLSAPADIETKPLDSTSQAELDPLGFDQPSTLPEAGERAIAPAAPSDLKGQQSFEESLVPPTLSQSEPVIQQAPEGNVSLPTPTVNVGFSDSTPETVAPDSEKTVAPEAVNPNSEKIPEIMPRPRDGVIASSNAEKLNESSTDQVFQLQAAELEGIEEPPQVLGDLDNQSAEPFSVAQRAELVPEPPELSAPELPVSTAPFSEQPLDSTQLNQPDYPAPESLSEPLLRQAVVEPEPSATSLSESPTNLEAPTLSAPPLAAPPADRETKTLDSSSPAELDPSGFEQSIPTNSESISQPPQAIQSPHEISSDETTPIQAASNLDIPDITSAVAQPQALNPAIALEAPSVQLQPIELQLIEQTLLPDSPDFIETQPQAIAPEIPTAATSVPEPPIGPSPISSTEQSPTSTNSSEISTSTQSDLPLQSAQPGDSQQPLSSDFSSRNHQLEKIQHPSIQPTPWAESHTLADLQPDLDGVAIDSPASTQSPAEPAAEILQTKIESVQDSQEPLQKAQQSQIDRLSPAQTAAEPSPSGASELSSADQSTQLPKLPTVLQPLSVWEPLAQPPLINAAIPPLSSPAQPVPSTQLLSIQLPSIQAAWGDRSESPSLSPPNSTREPSQSSRADRENAGPTDWSNIAELFQTSVEPSTTQASTTQASAAQLSIPQAPQSSPGEAYPNLNLYPQSDATVESILQRAPAQSEAPPTLPDLSSPDSLAPDSLASEEASQPSQPGKSQASPEQFEQLAQEIYRLLRQRLAIERERSGQSYSGRLL